MEHRLLTLTGIKENRTMLLRNVDKCTLRPMGGNGMMGDVPILFIMFAKLKVGVSSSKIFLLPRKKTS